MRSLGDGLTVWNFNHQKEHISFALVTGAAFTFVMSIELNEVSFSNV